MRLIDQLVFASGNRHKLEELREIVTKYTKITIIPAQDLLRNASKIGAVEVHNSAMENALAKARLVNHGTHYPTLADDTCLEVQALQGRPGVRTHRFGTPVAGQSQDSANIEKLLTELRGIPMERRSARFVTAVALVIEGVSLSAQGILEGTIVEAPRGQSGFGYDCVFMPKNTQRTLAELSAEEKNRVSHRALAVAGLFREMELAGIEFVMP